MLLNTIFTIFILSIGTLIFNLNFINPMIITNSITLSPIEMQSVILPIAEQHQLCSAGYMVFYGGFGSPMCVPMPVNENQSLNISITPLTMIKEFAPNATIPVNHTRLILSDRFGIDTTAWWPTLLRTQFASIPTHAIIIETVDSESKNKSFTLGFRQAIPADLPRLVLAADPYLGTGLISRGGSTWPNITIGNPPWWWSYSFQ